MKNPTQPDAVIGRFEIGLICKVTRQGVASVLEHPDFPAPICLQGKNKAPLFWRRDVESFQAERERLAAADSSAVTA